MSDIYLYDDVPVLKNKLEIKDEKTLDLIEAEQSHTSMMLLYEKGFADFSAAGFALHSSILVWGYLRMGWTVSNHQY